MLQLNPSKRITAAEALNHPYFHSDPLPCNPYELPTFNADFHEYTVRKDRKESQPKPVAFVKKNSMNNRSQALHQPEGMHKRPKSRGAHLPGGHGQHGKNYVKPSHDQKMTKVLENHQGENLVCGTKRPHPVPMKGKAPEAKPKLYDESLTSNLHPKPTPGLLSLVKPEEAQRSGEVLPKTTSPKLAIAMLRQNHNLGGKKRDKKEEYKGTGRGTIE